MSYFEEIYPPEPPTTLFQLLEESCAEVDRTRDVLYETNKLVKELSDALKQIANGYYTDVAGYNLTKIAKEAFESKYAKPNNMNTKMKKQTNTFYSVEYKIDTQQNGNLSTNYSAPNFESLNDATEFAQSLVNSKVDKKYGSTPIKDSVKIFKITREEL